MEYRRLGNSGLKVSVIGLGANRFGAEKMPQEEVNRVLDKAEDLGINFIDSADLYTKGQSEETIGKALKGRWDRFVVATKFRFNVSNPDAGPVNQQGASRFYIMNALEASLRRLGRDHIDVYYLHAWDDETPIDETLRALDDLVRMGKVRYIAASNFASWQLARANLQAEVNGWTQFIAIQNHYNMFERQDEREMLPFCAAHNVGYIPYFPLASGFLTGKYQRGKIFPKGSRAADFVKAGRPIPYNTDWHYDRIENLSAWAKVRGRGLNELAQAWLLAKPQVSSVISGATKLEQLESNAKASGWKLTDEEVEEVNKILD